MKLQIWKDGERYKVLQKQRLNDGTSGYQTIQVGVVFKEEAPSGEKYISLKIDGLTDNAVQKKESIIDPVTGIDCSEIKF
jgi:hypothetical protein